MFKESIETVSRFTRAIHSITRNFSSNKIIPGAATLFFVNEEGFAVTCRHVAEILVNADAINQRYATFRTERDMLLREENASEKLVAMQARHQFNKNTTIQLKHRFIDCVDQLSGFTVHLHPTYDIAIVKFNDYTKLCYQEHAVFVNQHSSPGQGDFLCRLGYPFPEFSNFRFNDTRDDIEWTSEGIAHSPRFPIEGMVTRFLADQQQVFGIEMSTPGLKGQSGGPLFNSKGFVCGMQFATSHFHLGFDIVDKEIIFNTEPRIVSDYSFLHLGQCVHADIIKSFLREKSVKYYEE